MSLDLISRHRHASIALIWNLDRDSYEELYYQLNPPSHVKFDDVWYLLGGNPGKLIELSTRYDWSIDSMIESYRDTIEQFMREITGKELLGVLEAALEDIDVLYREPGEEVVRLERALVERNLVVYKKRRSLSGEYVPPSRDLGIGEYYAWQVPMYREILKNIIGKKH